MRQVLLLSVFGIVATAGFRPTESTNVTSEARFKARCATMQQRLGADSQLAINLCDEIVKFNKSK